MRLANSILLIRFYTIVKIFFLTAIIILLTYNNTNAQSWVWSNKIGNTQSDKATCIKTDSSGNIYVAGYFSDNISLGINNLILNYTENDYSKEAFIAKFDSTGFCFWARSGGQYYDDRVLGMDVDAEGNSIITGTFWEGSGIQFSGNYITGSAFGSGDQCFIVKYDKNGNYLWGNFVCSNGYEDDQGLDVATDKAGNSYVVGFMGGNTLYCGGNTITATNTDNSYEEHSYWIAKINSVGQFQWAKCFGNLPFDYTAYKYIERDIAVCVDDSGGVYITGGYDDTQTFGSTTLTSTGGYDIFIMKYNTSGTFQWVINGGSDKDDWANGICSDKNGNVYVVGEHRDSLIIDTVIVNNYNKRDAFVLKIDATTGKPIWGKRAGSNLGGERGNDVWADSFCNVYVCGDINENAKFGDNITTGAGKYEEAFVAKISPEGKWKWVATGGGIDSNDRANAIVKGKGAQVYVCGFFRAPATFGTDNLISSGSSDGFFSRLHDSLFNKIEDFILLKPVDSILCKNEIIQLNIPPHTYIEYTPLTGVTANSDNSILTFNPAITTTYTISGLGEGNCSNYDTIIFTIYKPVEPVAEFTVNSVVATNTTSTFILNNLSVNASNYEWYYNYSLISTNVNINQVFNSVDYCFTLLAYSSIGCIDSISYCDNYIAPIPPIKGAQLPSAFSPNGDGNNDWLFVYGGQIEKIFLSIYNRWGELIFESTSIDNGWNGSFKGNNAPSGVYVYKLQIIYSDGEKETKSGNITLIR